MPSVPPRDLAPLLGWFRNLFLGRKFKNSLRFQELVATRSPPPPNLPDGPSHKLSSNDYFTRDGRHFARPPVALIEETKKKALTVGVKENTEIKAVANKKVGEIFPGKPYVWEQVPKPSSS